jgi:hypothetical protein
MILLLFFSKVAVRAYRLLVVYSSYPKAGKLGAQGSQFGFQSRLQRPRQRKENDGRIRVHEFGDKFEFVDTGE